MRSFRRSASSILVAAAPAAFACALLLTPAPARAETLITAVVLSDGSQPGCMKDVDWAFGTAETEKKLGIGVHEKLVKAHPELKRRSFASKENYRDVWSGSKKTGIKVVGNWLVVVRTTTPHHGCSGPHMGVGFGKDEASAKKEAMKNLGKRWLWVEDSDPVEILESGAH